MQLLLRFYRHLTPRNLLFLNLALLLTLIVFFVLRDRFSLVWLPVEAQFLSPLEPEQAALLERTFETFAKALDAHNISFFIFSGTLVGSVRHHGIIPWDDDIDILVNITDRDRLVRALSTTNPAEYTLYSSTSGGADYAYQWKFYPTAGRSLIHKSYRSPNVDVFFFVENDTHVWNSSPYFSDTEVWQKNTVFPLQPRPFGDLLVPAPCNPLAFLGRNFDISECRSREFSHVYDIPLPFKAVTVPCERLSRLYPFVRRSRPYRNRTKQFVTETLMLGKAALRRFSARISC